MITREIIESRMIELKKQRSNAIANVNAIEGAVHDCQFWLSVIEKESQEALSPDVGSDTP